MGNPRNPATFGRYMKRSLHMLNKWTTDNVNIDSQRVEGQSTQNSTTVTTDGGNVVTATKASAVPAMTKLDTWLSGNLHQDISSFMEKPVQLIHFGSLGSTVGAIYQAPIPETAFIAPQSPYPDKVKGFLGFKATSVFTLRVNATKFTQGRVAIGWIPNADRRNAGNYFLRSPKAFTQLPHVEMDISCDSSCVLRVPYYSLYPYGYVPQIGSLADDLMSFGDVVVYIYSPPAVGAAATDSAVVDATLYVHFEDVELVTPMVAGVAQAGTGRTLNVKAEDKERDAPISKALAMTSKVAENMASVPMLSSFMQPAAWVLSAASRTAASFGFSKPVLDAAPQRIARQELAYMNNKEGTEALIPMGFSAVNTVGISPSKTGSEMDEMSLDYVSQISAWVDTFQMTTTSAYGDLIYGKSLGGPNDIGKSAGPTYDTVLTTFDLAPLTMLWQMFHYFHGDIILKFKVVKTAFHSGRIVVIFNPAGSVTNLTVNNPYALRQILDLADGNEFEIVLPHCNTSYWLALSTRSNDIFGSISVFVLNPLIAPDTCSNSIKFLVEMRAAPGAQFAVPKYSGMAPCISNAMRNQTEVTPAKFSMNVAQSGDPCDSIAETGSFGGLAPLDKSSLQYSEMIIGEKVDSLKQLCGVANRWGQVNLTNQYGFVGRLADSICYSVGSQTDGSRTNLSVIAACYGYATGSYKYYFQLTSATAATAPIVSLGLYETAPFVPTTPVPQAATGNWNYAGWMNQYAMSTSSTTVGSISVPAYNQLPMRIINNQDSNYGVGKSPVVFTVNYQGANSGWIHTWRALGDDGYFAFWLGTPPVTGI